MDFWLSLGAPWFENTLREEERFRIIHGSQRNDWASYRCRVYCSLHTRKQFQRCRGIRWTVSLMLILKHTGAWVSARMVLRQTLQTSFLIVQNNSLMRTEIRRNDSTLVFTTTSSRSYLYFLFFRLQNLLASSAVVGDLLVACAYTPRFGRTEQPRQRTLLSYSFALNGIQPACAEVKKIFEHTSGRHKVFLQIKLKCYYA